MRSRGSFPPDHSLIQLIKPNKVVERVFREGARLFNTLQTSETLSCAVNCFLPVCFGPRGSHDEHNPLSVSVLFLNNRFSF